MNSNYPINKLIGIVKELENRGKHVEIKLLGSGYVVKDKNIWKQLKIAENGKAYVITRSIYENGEPLLVDSNVMPSNVYAKIRNIDLEKDTFFESLQESGYTIEYALQNVRSIAANDKFAEMLNIEKGAPIFYIERTVYSSKDEPLLYTQAFFDASKYVFSMQLNAKE